MVIHIRVMNYLHSFHKKTSPAKRAHSTVELLCEEAPDFISPGSNSREIMSGVSGLLFHRNYCHR